MWMGPRLDGTAEILRFAQDDSVLGGRVGGGCLKLALRSFGLLRTPQDDSLRKNTKTKDTVRPISAESCYAPLGHDGGTHFACA
jgi:hypothetical protein